MRLSSRGVTALTVTSGLALLACRPDRLETAPTAPLLLARHPDALVALELPATNHPGGLATSDTAQVDGDWDRCWHEDALEQYCTTLPVGQVFYGHSSRTAPVGMVLLDLDGEPIPYNWDRSAKPEITTWRVRDGSLQLRPPQGGAPPVPGELALRYPPAAAWENALDPGTSSLEGHDFALREVSIDDDVRHGVLLPAPGLARWKLTVPEAAVLDLDARILPPAVDQGVRSDGARLRVLLRADGVETELLNRALNDERWRVLQVELGAWAGQQVELELVTEPGDNKELDYVFLANPAVYTPSRAPAQVVLIFVDTLRRDHLGMYDYHRPTSPSLDAWAAEGVVFDDARATSSWTLPSTRALLTGMPQGAWGQTSPLQERLGQAGFTTAAFVANAFLTSSFDMGHGWGQYRYALLAPAEEQVDRSLVFLQRHQDRDAMVMIQLMDPHMPYNEPESYRGRWEGDEPDGLAGKINRRGLRDMKLNGDRRERVRDYLLGRYDQNIQYVDHELDRLLDGLRDDAVVVLFSDHGEEFFEHGSIEHGHTLYDELLRVPLVVRAPGLAPARVQTPVSLLDLTPTLLDLLGLDDDPTLLGRSLLPLAHGDAQAIEALAQRPLFFGGVLYDDEAWGVRAPAGLKWISRGGTQQLYDLMEDPSEQTDLARLDQAQLERFPALLARALDREVLTLWRINGRGTGRLVHDFDGTVELYHPGGLVQAWHPPSLTGDMAPLVIHDDRLTVSTGPGFYLPREIFVQPGSGTLDATGLELRVVTSEDQWERQRSARARPAVPTRARRQLLVTAGKGDARFTVGLHHGPLPYPDDPSFSATDGGMDDHLKALGYIDE